MKEKQILAFVLIMIGGIAMIFYKESTKWYIYLPCAYIAILCALTAKDILTKRFPDE